MDLGVVVVIIAVAWLALFVLVLAMCRAASHADAQELRVQDHVAPRQRRLRPHFHGLHLHRG
jgi:hypothetical protein